MSHVLGEELRRARPHQPVELQGLPLLLHVGKVLVGPLRSVHLLHVVGTLLPRVVDLPCLLNPHTSSTPDMD